MFQKELECDTNGRPQAVQLQLYSTGDNINIQISCRDDLQFLYTLDIKEEEFLALKSAQNLLVDFTAFPEKLIDLLNSPFSVQLDLAATRPRLRIVETNSFKHITHIELALIKASDATLKKYLADLVTRGILQYKSLSESTSQQISELEDGKRANEQEISDLRGKVESLNCQVQDIKTSTAVDLVRAADESKQKEDKLLREKDAEKRSLEVKHEAEIRNLSKQLTAAQTALQHQNKHSQSQQENMLANTKQIESLNKDLATARYDNEKNQLAIRQAEKRTHELELSVQNLQDRKERAERRCAEYEESAKRVGSLLEGRNSGYSALERQVRDLQSTIEFLEEKVRVGEDEVKKANSIISKLQSEVKATKSKLKLKNEVTIQQEKLLEEKSHSMEMMEKEMAKLTESLVAKQEALAQETSRADALEKKVEESKDLIRDNNHVIEWLHRQLNENALATDFDRYAGMSQGHTRAAGLAGAPTMDFVATKPSPQRGDGQPTSHHHLYQQQKSSATQRYAAGATRPPTATSPIRLRQQAHQSPSHNPGLHAPVYAPGHQSKISGSQIAGASVAGAVAGYSANSGSGMMMRGGLHQRILDTAAGGGTTGNAPKSNYFS
ncbi:MAG: hypothetical protein SGCHY_005146 [Lobulomycetales sp.]